VVPGRILYSNEDMAGDLQEITRQAALEDFRPHAVIGIARGGIVPATMLSHYYNVPLITLNLSLRDNMVQGPIDYAGIRAQLLGDHKLLLVDDICDSGATFAMIVDNLRNLHAKNVGDLHMENLKSVALWNNTAQDVFKPDYVGREISRAEDDRWVIFPYEEWWKV
jgi:hypoxanthine phosphoribosyltransferase